VKSERRAVFVGVAALAGVAALLLIVFNDAAGEGRRAVGYSAALALVVQAIAFRMTWRAAPEKLMSRWGMAALVRFLTLVVYALVLLKPLGLAPVPALISLAAFYFVTTVLESLLLKS
jgi:ABC-type uncharacterized transport system permease subunit